MVSGLTWPWLVTDLDGTLVDRSQRIVVRSAAALARYRAAGGVVVIATGRNEESAGRYHTQLGLDTPMILYNGARIVDPATGVRLLDLELGPPWLALRDEVLPRLPPGVGAVGFRDQLAHVLRAAPALAHYARRDGIELSGDLPDGRVTKVMLIAPEPGLDALAELVHTWVADVRVLQSEDTYLEVLPAAAGKGAALRFLVDRAGLAMEQIAAIGDNPNDVDMLQVAGLSAAVGDGHPAARAVADLVVSSCADGAVADLVQRLLDGARMAG